jgi:hypothetical protein
VQEGTIHFYFCYIFWSYLPSKLLVSKGDTVCRSKSICGLPVFDPRHSRIVKVADIALEWLDATYSAFKVPIGVAIYQDCAKLGLLTMCDMIAGQNP